MWKRTEVKKEARYFLQLCQDPNAQRYVRLVQVGSAGHHPDRVFDTEEIRYGSGVSIEHILNRDLMTLSKHVRIVGGRHFFFDAYGIWLTDEELRQLEEDEGVEVWSTAVPPAFPPI